MKKYRVQYDVTLKFTAFVEVEGDFMDINDSHIDPIAEKKVRNMSIDDMGFDDEEYEIIDVVELKKGEE